MCLGILQGESEKFQQNANVVIYDIISCQKCQSGNLPVAFSFQDVLTAYYKMIFLKTQDLGIYLLIYLYGFPSIFFFLVTDRIMWFKPKKIIQNLQ